MPREISFPWRYADGSTGKGRLVADGDKVRLLFEGKKPAYEICSFFIDELPIVIKALQDADDAAQQ